LLAKKILIVLLLSNFFLLPLFLKGSQKTNNLQKECESILGNRKGCIGIFDLREEKIITIVNLGLFKTRTVKPGSLIKILIAITALNNGKVNPFDIYCCHGEDLFHNSKFKCWTKDGHQSMDMVNAIAQSCNLYFYHIASKLSLSDIYRTYSLFQFNERSPFNLVGELPGLLKEVNLDIEKYYLATGRSENLLVTPAQMLYLISVIAKRGKLFDSKIDLRSKTYEPIYNGLRNSVINGTSKQANYIPFMPAGKTGTFSEQYNLKTSAWFIGYAPFNNPEIAIVVFLEKGQGASDTAPIANRVFKCYYKLFHQ